MRIDHWFLTGEERGNVCVRRRTGQRDASGDSLPEPPGSGIEGDTHVGPALTSRRWSTSPAQVLEMREQGGLETERFTVARHQERGILMVAVGDNVETRRDSY